MAEKSKVREVVETVRAVDPQVADLIEREERREEETILSLIHI